MDKLIFMQRKNESKSFNPNFEGMSHSGFSLPMTRVGALADENGRETHFLPGPE